eukprot:gene28631-31796_t
MGPPMFQKGQRIGEDNSRWLITRKLGEGQFAEVYEVRDTHARDRDYRLQPPELHVSMPPGIALASPQVTLVLDSVATT